MIWINVSPMTDHEKQELGEECSRALDLRILLQKLTDDWKTALLIFTMQYSSSYAVLALFCK